jgi:dTDP-L-rhamnose 4-epimerase
MGTELNVLRLQNVYGVGQSLGNPYTGVLSLFTKLALAGEALPVYEDGEIIRDFVYIDDVVHAVVSAVVAGSRLTQRYPVLDIGSGVPSTIGDVAATIAQMAGAPKPKVTGQYNDGDVRAAWCEIDGAKEALGYAPQWSLSDGLDALMVWVRAERDGQLN